MATKENATVVVTWNYGKDIIVDDFDPQSDTIFIDWFGPNEITVTEDNGDLIFSIPSNDQTITLKDVALGELEPANLTIKNSGTEKKILDLIAEAPDVPVVPEEPVTPVTPDEGDGPRVVGWFQESGVYGRDYNVSDVPVEHLTHLVYAFAVIDENGEIAVNDSYAALEKTFDADEDVDGIKDPSNQELRGNFNQLAELKEANPDLTIMIAVGGWNKSHNFSSTFATEEGREKFAESVVAFLKDYPMFDGVDLDWEFPGGGGLKGNEESPEDGANYALAVKAIREALDGLEVETGRDYEISVATPTSATKVANSNISGLEPYVDFFNMMAYDIHAPNKEGTTPTNHQAPIFDVNGRNQDLATAVELYLEYGIPADKIVLGAPAYGRAWAGVDADDPASVLYQTNDGKAPGSFHAGTYDYKDLLEKLQDPDSGWTLYYDDDSQAAYVWNVEEKIFSTFETPETIALKAEWAQSLGLGGMQFWSLLHDATGSQESLVKAAADVLLNGQSLEDIANASELEFEAVFGGDGKVTPFWEDDGQGDTVVVTWQWGEQKSYNFDPSEDVLEFNTNIASKHLTFEEVDDDLVITVLNNGGHTYLLEGVQAEDLTIENLVNADEGMIAQLESLGMEDIII